MRRWTARRTSALSFCAISLLRFSICDFGFSIEEARADQPKIANPKSKLFARLAGAQLELHVGVADALALVGVGLAQAVHLGGDLPELLLVDARERQRQLVLLDAGLGRDALAPRLDALGQGELDGVRVAQGEDDLPPLHV